MKIAIIGYGKMGKTIEALAMRAGDEVVLKIDTGNQEEFTVENLQKADVALEFSRPESAFQNIIKCLRAGIPVVSGTTGWLDQMEQVRTCCYEMNGAFFYASNFSIGVNIFFAINRYLAKLMARQTQYDVSMEEIHHTQKLDAPSGTAITLAEDILAQLPRKQKWVNKPTADAGSLAVISKRIGDVPGTHTVRYESDMDEIEIKHTARKRESFATGALLAAQWILGKRGMFNMEDLLEF